MLLLDKALIILYLIFGQTYEEITVAQKIAVAPMVYEEPYEYADIVYTDRKTVTVLWRFDSFGTLQPFVAQVQYSENEPKPVICRNSDEYQEVVIVYESNSFSYIKDKCYVIDVFRYCPIKREIRQIVLKDSELRIPQLSGALRNAITQTFPQNVDKFEFKEELSEIYDEYSDLP